MPLYYYNSDLPDKTIVKYESSAESPLTLYFQCAYDSCSPSEIWCKPSDFDVAWFRRASPPTLPPHLTQGDREVALKDWRNINESMELVIQNEVNFCINPPPTKVGRHHKSYHLWLASQYGLNIPPSLITNDMDSINKFIEEYDTCTSSCIAKPMFLPTWEFGEKSSVVFTTSIVCKETLTDSDVTSDPIIFQKEIKKLYEVRITKIGHELIAVEIDSQSTDDGKLDFRRSADWRDLGHNIVHIPDDVNHKIKAVCNKLGLIFCTIDFIVDVSGKWVFLEINHMGNWLWIEAYNPKIKLLSRMSQMIAAGRQNYEYDDGIDISLAPYIEIYEKHIESDKIKESIYHPIDSRNFIHSDD